LEAEKEEKKLLAAKNVKNRVFFSKKLKKYYFMTCKSGDTCSIL
jgi:hypothetical protein